MLTCNRSCTHPFFADDIISDIRKLFLTFLHAFSGPISFSTQVKRNIRTKPSQGLGAFHFLTKL